MFAHSTCDTRLHRTTATMSLILVSLLLVACGLAEIAAVVNRLLSLQRVQRALNKRSANDCFLTPGSRNHSRFFWITVAA